MSVQRVFFDLSSLYGNTLVPEQIDQSLSAKEHSNLYSAPFFISINTVGRMNSHPAVALLIS